jgi:hypothetical protein
LLRKPNHVPFCLFDSVPYSKACDASRPLKSQNGKIELRFDSASWALDAFIYT